MGLVRVKLLVSRWLEFLMWWRHKTQARQYVVQKMWFNLDRDISAQDAYDQAVRFVRHTINISPRPYGRGAYGLVLAAAWDGDRRDRWEVDFKYFQREGVYEQLAARMAEWSPHPLCIGIFILPYGSLALGRPTGEAYAK